MPAPNPYAGKFVWDSWGRRARGDFVYDPDEGKWEISGSNGPDNYQLFNSAAEAEAWAQANPVAAGLGPGPSQSENAYNAALQAQGINPSELPMSAGQELTARVLQQHGLQIPEYLRAFLGTPAGGGNSAQPGLWSIPAGANPALPDGGLDLSMLDNFRPDTVYPIGLMAQMSMGGGGGGQAPDPFQNTIAARFLARTQQTSDEQKQQMLRDFIKKVMLAGQQKKQPVSPGLVAAAMGRVAV